MPRITLKKVVLSVIIVMFACGLTLKSTAIRSDVSAQPVRSAGSQPADVPYTAVYTGSYICLPLKDERSPSEQVCRPGLRLDDGTYIAVSFGGAPARYLAGDRLELSGIFVPIEQISADFWRSYPITGILDVKADKKI